MAAKRRRQSQGARRHAGPPKGRGPAWFLIGALTGGLVVWVMLGRDPAAEQVRATVERTVGHSIEVESTTPPPKFEFYTLLPEMEVVVPDEELTEPPPAPARSGSTDEAGAKGETATADKVASTPKEEEDDGQGKEGPSLKPGHYILQVASFRSMKDADGLKAKLILNGFNPVVQSVVISGEEKRYRVRLGPYPDRGSLEAARAQLRERGHDKPLVLRVKRG